jgi:hypothetical protein
MEMRRIKGTLRVVFVVELLMVSVRITKNKEPAKRLNKSKEFKGI